MGVMENEPSARVMERRQGALLKNLRHLVAAAEAGSFHKAAERLGIVQSALSRRIADIETTLGAPIFIRSAAGVQLTEAGQILYEDALHLLNETDQSVRRFERTRAGQVWSLRVAFNGPAMMHPALPLGLQRFRHAHPNVELRLTPMMSQAQFAMIENGSADIGIAFDLGLRPALASRAVAMDRLALALPVHHPLAVKKHLNVLDLEGVVVIGMERPASERLAELTSEQLRRAGVSVRTAFDAGNTETALSLVAGGLGVAFVNRSQKGREPPSVVIRDVEDFDLPLPLCLYWSPAVETPFLAAFADMIEQAFVAS